MAETSISVKDAASATQTLGTQTISSKQYAGHYLKAVPEAGATPYQNLDVGTTGAVVKASAGQLYGVLAFNLAGFTPSGAYIRYLKIYDKATAPTQADTPKLTIVLDPAVDPVLPLPACGVAFANGIGIRATTGLAVADTGAPGTNEVVVNLLYA